MKYTDKIVINDTKPKINNVNWIDTSQNPPVLKSFINGEWVPTGGSGTLNPGYTVTRSFVNIDNEQILTIEEPNMSFSVGLFANSIRLEEGSTYTVVFDGTEYQCVAEFNSDAGGITLRAAPDFFNMDFSEYPFMIINNSIEGEEITEIFTENPGTHQVEIKESSIESITVSNDFSDAVEYINSTLPSLKCATVVPNDYSDWTAGFKIYFQKIGILRCIYDTIELNIRPEVIVDNETYSMRINSGNRQLFSRELLDIDALLVPSFNNTPNVILYKNNYQQDGDGMDITFSSVNQVSDNSTIITGSNCIHIYCSMVS